MSYFKNTLIHTNNCNQCCKEYCTNCYSISLEEVELLIEQLEAQISINSIDWLNKIKYDFKSCYSKEIHLMSNIYLRYLRRYRLSIINGGKATLKKKENNQILENIKDILSVCNSTLEITSLQIDMSEYDQWAEDNPIYANLAEWEIEPFDPKSKNITYTTHMDYDSLGKCNITLNTYKELIKCDLTHELISEIIGCNMITENTSDVSNCILEINNNKYTLCDLQVNPSLKEELINDLKEIKLI